MPEMIPVLPLLIEHYSKYADLLIVTATPTEKKELHKHLSPIDGQKGIIKIQKDQYTYYLGRFGFYNTIHVATGNMGSINRGASIATTMKAIELWKPKAVLMPGIAFGAKPDKVKIGDVLVAERVVNYETSRYNQDGTITYRAPEGPASSLLLSRFVDVDDWEHHVKYDDQDYSAKQINGLILSGEKLVDNKAFKAQLMDHYPTAIGGEMEGAGVYTACEGRVPHWILVKGVCDYGDGDKDENPNKDLFQELAIQSAISLCEKVFSAEYSFNDIGLYAGSIPDPEPQAQESKKKIYPQLTDQLNRQLAKQKASQKYIPETFVEIEENKEMLRYFCDPIAFIPKVMGEFRVLDFSQLNAMRGKKGHEPFQFEIQGFVDRASSVTLEDFDYFFQEWNAYNKGKIHELENPPVASNDMRSFSYKVNHLSSSSEWLAKKVCLICENAGQGKTNFICDLVDNFILKHKIPSVFVLGTDINPLDIRGSILRKIYPDRTDVIFTSVLTEIEVYCKTSGKPFIIIIDGINETADADRLSTNLEDFISEMTEKNFIRVIVSCRSEYYNKHYSNLEKAGFSPYLGKTRALTIHRKNRAAEKIFIGYLSHFNIHLKSYSEKVFAQLTENFLLLRIFCDSHRGEKIQFLGNIHKEQLFRRYYQTKVEEITKRMREDDELRVTGGIDIRNFLQKLIMYMVDNRTFENIPLDGLIEKEENRKVYVRFLDENILVRRDPKGADSIFDDQEVVNFTFDEFRDYLLSDYLITKVYSNDRKKFISFLKEQINPSSRILEGCGTFLFYIARKSENADLQQIVEGQEWFASIFIRCIFNMEDRLITADDRKRVFLQLKTDHYLAVRIFYSFLHRHRLADTPNLNLEHYLENLRSLSNDEFQAQFSRLFAEHSYSTDIAQGEFLENIETHVDTPEEKFPHALFEVLVYMFANRNSFMVMELYERYCHKFPNQAKQQLARALACQSNRLEQSIKLFCRRYDIHV